MALAKLGLLDFLLRLYGQVSLPTADVSTPVSVETAVKKVLEEFGRIDILVNNAGRQSPITIKPLIKDVGD